MKENTAPIPAQMVYSLTLYPPAIAAGKMNATWSANLYGYLLEGMDVTILHDKRRCPWFNYS